MPNAKVITLHPPTTKRFNKQAARIRALEKSSEAHTKSLVTNTIEIGRLLTEVQAKLPHGQWLPWIQTEFAWEIRTAQRYLQIYQHRDEIRPAGRFCGLEVLQLITAPSTPAAARAEVLAIPAATPVTAPQAKSLITKHKTAAKASGQTLFKTSPPTKVSAPKVAPRDLSKQPLQDWERNFLEQISPIKEAISKLSSKARAELFDNIGAKKLREWFSDSLWEQLGAIKEREDEAY